jgi:uncharacterized protein
MWSNMPKVSAKKTKSALKNGIWLGVFIVLFGLIAVALWIENHGKTCVAKLERADSNQQQLRGLSGRNGLPTGTGMLFSFGQPATQCMWMKDMRFAIDMIWLNDRKEIIKVEPNVSPQTYPASFCAENTKYVIELNSGEATKYGFVPGGKLKF